jgi:uncharacterized protein (TIGR02246 family)
MEGDELSEVRDALAIRALCERYAQAVDAGDAVGFASLFTPDGHLVSNFGGRDSHYNGREELSEVPGRAKGVAPTTMHFLGNHLTEIQRETATGLTYCLAHHLRDDRSNLVMMVRYFDQYVRTDDGGWLISDRRVSVDWTETRQADSAES